MTEEIKVKDMVGNKEGTIKFNFTKVKEAIKKCELDQNSQKCKRELSEMGIEFIEG